MEGNLNPINVGSILAEEVARAPGILTREMVLLQNFNFSGKVAGGYTRRHSELDVIPEQHSKGAPLHLKKRTP
jgi:hypothetical protein